ncbi:MAG TPA: hypothetical protein VLH08_16375, partial [Acidobacteriota bacterium]|nr:hypothetical protein [Acidobacteriota bacterium]
WFGRGANPIAPDSDEFRSFVADQYFKFYYPSRDPAFHDTDRNDIPDILEPSLSVFSRSRHFIQTVLGWPLPSSRLQTGSPQLDVYFIAAGKRFSGSVYMENSLHIVLNKSILSSTDFQSLWIHQFAHAAELSYKPSGEYWFYEATAGWMEGQFQKYASSTSRAQRQRFERPEVSLTDDDPVNALGASRFIELLARPAKDVIRQTWEQWSYSRDAKVMEVLGNVLTLNHLPSLNSQLQNYFLTFPKSSFKRADEAEYEVQPYAAALLRGDGDDDSGGMKLQFLPSTQSNYSTSTMFFPKGEKSGILSMKLALEGPSSIMIPFAGLDYFRYVLVNGSAELLRGELRKENDSSIPGSLEYFKVVPEEKGVLIEWKTARENGVAFWNLYRVRDGQKEKLNAFPIPASIQSEEGIHYIFYDSSSSSFYSLEAITSEGFPSPLGNSEPSQ